MTVLSGPRAALPDAVDVVTAFQRSNHATAIAGWTMTMIAMGLVFQVHTVTAVVGTADGALFAGALAAVVAGVIRSIALLRRAGHVIALAQEQMFRFCGTHDSPDADSTWRLLESLIAATANRETLTRRALVWAYASGVTFLAWSVVANLAVH